MVPNYFGFFLAQFFGVLSRLLHVSIVHSFFNVELYSSVLMYHSLTVHPLKDIWIVSIFQPLWINYY